MGLTLSSLLHVALFRLAYIVPCYRGYLRCDLFLPAITKKLPKQGIDSKPWPYFHSCPIINWSLSKKRKRKYIKIFWSAVPRSIKKAWATLWYYANPWETLWTVSITSIMNELTNPHQSNRSSIQSSSTLRVAQHLHSHNVFPFTIVIITMNPCPTRPVTSNQK